MNSHLLQRLFHTYLHLQNHLPTLSKIESSWSSVSFEGLHFPNPLGIAGGLDKNAQFLPAWQKLGAGFIEVGTLTPQLEKGHPGKVLDKNKKHQALWNHMGFPNRGCDFAAKKIKHFKNRNIPLFINIGKSKQTPLKKATEDYQACFEKMQPYGDTFVINISSPNSPGLRELLNPTNLRPFLKDLKSLSNKPVLLKLSPDLDDNTFKQVVEIALEEGLKGFNCTNTTTWRPSSSYFPKHGGLSGKPLAPTSIQKLKLARSIIGDRKDILLVSTGGILSPKDVLERLEMGANLVQVYAAVVFHGPSFFAKCSHELR